MRYNKLIYLAFIMFFDVISYYLSLYFAFNIRKLMDYVFIHLPDFTFSFSHFVKLFWIPIVILAFIAYEGLYNGRFPYQEELRRIIKSIVFSFISIFFIVGMVKAHAYVSRLMLAFLFLNMLFILPISRLLVKFLLHKTEIGIRNLILIGFDEAYKKDIVKLLKDINLGYKLIGIIDDNLAGTKVEIDGKLYKAHPTSILNKKRLLKGIDSTVILTERIDREVLPSLTVKAQSISKEVIIIPSLNIYNVLNFEQIPLYFSELIFFKFRDNLKSGVNITVKTLFDYILSVFLFIPFLVLLIFIAIFIKIESKGPVIIKHKRIGKGGKPINIYKFRTMFENAEQMLENILKENDMLRKEWEEKRKLKYDPRITRVGRFLRKTSLDELPQIINVLKGEMSLIGPRPVTEEELSLYYREFKEVYFQVKPGISGYWQVSGRSSLSYDVRVAMDVFYVLNWSLWLDLFIIIKTVWVVFRGKGAY